MAKISYSELIQWLKKHPRYKDFELGVDAEVALYIQFGDCQRVTGASDLFPLSDGHEISLDRKDDGVICGFEIA
jgi:hypothetical protein